VLKGRIGIIATRGAGLDPFNQRRIDPPQLLVIPLQLFDLPKQLSGR